MCLDLGSARHDHCAAASESACRQCWHACAGDAFLLSAADAAQHRVADHRVGAALQPQQLDDQLHPASARAQCFHDAGENGNSCCAEQLECLDQMLDQSMQLQINGPEAKVFT